MGLLHLADCQSFFAWMEWNGKWRLQSMNYCTTREFRPLHDDDAKEEEEARGARVVRV